MRTFVLCSSDPLLSERIHNRADSYGYSFFGISDADRLMELLFRFPADTVLLDANGSVCDVVEQVHRITSLPVERPPHLFLIGDMPELCFLPKEVVYVFSRSASADDIFSRIQLLAPDPPERRLDSSLQDRICSEYLLRLGISPHLQGFDMLRGGIQYLLNAGFPSDVKIMYDLYPLLAAETGTNVSIVEHAMRHAVEAAWMRADLEDLEALFGYTTRESKPTPSNSAFLYTLAERIRMRLSGSPELSAISREMRRYDG